MVAARADVQIVLPLLDEHHLLALAAFVPEVVGGIALRGEGQGGADAVEPAHAAISFAPWIASARVRVKASRCGGACSRCSAMMSTNADSRSEEYTSELQSLMRSTYDVSCMKNKNTTTPEI